MRELKERPREAHRGAPLRMGPRSRGYRMLFARCHAGDGAARDELVERFLPLARAVARRYERPDEPLDDLVQVASLGLLKAIDRFDAGRGVAFTSFAVPTIAGELKRYFRDRTWAVRPPRSVQEMTLRVDAAAVGLSQQFDRPPTVRELAGAVGADDEQVLEALQALGARSALSLQAAADGATGGAPSLQDSLGRGDDGYERAEDRALVSGLMRYLSPREREVVHLRFERDLTQAEVGAHLGVSQMQVSRIVRGAITRLRHVADQQQMLGAAQARRRPEGCRPSPP